MILMMGAFNVLGLLSLCLLIVLMPKLIILPAPFILLIVLVT